MNAMRVAIGAAEIGAAFFSGVEAGRSCSPFNAGGNPGDGGSTIGWTGWRPEGLGVAEEHGSGSITMGAFRTTAGGVSIKNIRGRFPWSSSLGSCFCLFFLPSLPTGLSLFCVGAGDGPSGGPISVSMFKSAGKRFKPGDGAAAATPDPMGRSGSLLGEAVEFAATVATFTSAAQCSPASIAATLDFMDLASGR